MSPLLRLWGIAAICIALLMLLRGAFAAAIALFLLSPAPVLLFSHGRIDHGRASLSWLGVLFALIAAVSILFVVIVHSGGIPQVHEWPAHMRSGAK